MNKKYIWIAVVVVAIIAVFYGKYGREQATFGALPYSTNFTAVGLGVNDKYLNISAQRIDMTASSAVTCSILSPAATTSLAYMSAMLTGNVPVAGGITASTTTWTFATSTSATATTSPITSFTITNGFGGDMTWYPGVGNSIVSPSTYVNVSVSGTSTAALGSVAGVCQAEFKGL